MLFSSVSFLYYFLPVTLALYFLMPARFRNLVLLTASLFFYFYGEPVYLAVMVFSILAGYLHGLWIYGFRSKRLRKLPLVSSVVFLLGNLLFFKYSDFFIKNLNLVFNVQISALNLALPIGISFYTFQILSYIFDVYRGDAPVQKNILNFATYVTMFPQLIAGPIVRYTTIQEGLASRQHSLADFAYGVRRFVLGLGKKIIIADVLGELGKKFADSNEKTVVFFWVAAVAFLLQIYYDFSAYSDMAIGLGRMFGFHFLENFNYPLISQSVTEFWRRWHISLSTWFRDYVYIPLGGNRVSRLRWFFNIFFVWFLTGFWHGAEWNFVVWGLLFAVFLVIEKLFLKSILDKLPKLLRHLYLLFIAVICFVIFNADGLGEAFYNLKGMFGLLNVPLFNTETGYYLGSFAFVLIIAAVGATPLVRNVVETLKQKSASWQKVINAAEPLGLLLLMALVTGHLMDGSFSPFLYFRF